ncbi:hypothetical protein CCACVL1_08543 [Corchorus capsularis]|uniref:Uncharacterized protein n=1 Tax=Corchorus capsularis TaxID=210143 RepID=A0A1R3IZY8_COCAP|nr:hypothetical protein CCACVL1_08543 [Corchorus capsularis]
MALPPFLTPTTVAIKTPAAANRTQPLPSSFSPLPSV